MKKIYLNFLKKIFDFFKKKPQPQPRSPQEIENDKFRHKYKLEFLLGVYFVLYHFNEQWWYLRKWDEDYVFEETSGDSLRIQYPEYLENIITLHQEWLKSGKFFLPFR
jgi:hypothetical protein